MVKDPLCTLDHEGYGGSNLAITEIPETPEVGCRYRKRIVQTSLERSTRRRGPRQVA